jgi:diguanylate cyclase (GGDEF)-like protein
MISADRSPPGDMPMPASGQDVVSPGEVDQQILRIQRIGKRLFNVANCLIVLGEMPGQGRGSERSMASIEAAFCHGMPLSAEPVVVTDTHGDRAFCHHQAVIGAPYIRFFAGHPIHDENRVPIGRLCLIHYVTRSFDDGDRRALADLAVLVERELQLRSMNEAQLDLQKKNKNLRRKSLIDPLIGTWNRGAILRILEIEAIRCEKARAPLSLIVADLDFFKKINDTYGHPAGDAVLVKVASRLRSCIRPQEALGRYGGEEFLIVLPGSPAATAMAVAERMRQAIASHPEAVADTTLNLTISLGVASTDVFPGASTDDLISRADIALYAAKSAGRNSAVQATPDLS